MKAANANASISVKIRKVSLLSIRGYSQRETIITPLQSSDVTAGDMVAQHT